MRTYVYAIIILMACIGNAYSECQIGASFPTDNGQLFPISDIQIFANLTGKKLALVNTYINFTGTNSDFPALDCANAYQNGNIPIITWQPFNGQGTNTLQDIINGTNDVYINNFAQEVKSFNKNIFIRFGHEMNGSWYTWSGINNGGGINGPARYIAAFQHVHNIFSSIGANNVRWVWCPNANSVSNVLWNAAINYYPGNAYVDWIGVDGYNWGDTNNFNRQPWVSFDQIFGSIYNTLISGNNKPVMIAEFACSSVSNTYPVDQKKAAWITSAFSTIKNNYPRIKAVVWFDFNKEMDWRVESGNNSLNAYRQAISDPYFWGYGSVDAYSSLVPGSHPDNLEINIGPNYFKTSENAQLNIFYEVNNASTISIKVYNSNGKLIKTLANNLPVSGNNNFNYLSWNGQDETGVNVNSGLYLIDIKEGASYHKTEKIILIR